MKSVNKTRRTVARRAEKQFFARWKPWLGVKKSRTTGGSDSVAPTLKPDVLIEPMILEAAKLAQAGSVVGKLEERALTVEEIAKTMIAIGWAGPPIIEMVTLARLAELLTLHPGLYWHPLVERQIRYLRRLQTDKGEWRRLEWHWDQQCDGEYEVYTPPNEVAEVDRQLANLVEAHATGLFPQRRIQWKSALKQPGQKAELKNPHPTWQPWSDSVSAPWLYEDSRVLREAFKVRLRKAKDKPRTKREVKEWYRRLAQEVLQSSSVGWWSNYRDLKTDDGRLCWKPLDLDAALEAMLDGKTGHDGKPAYLACAVLGALLDVTPAKIRSTIDNYVHPRRVKKSR